jgi:hypothetical protein
VHGLIKVDRYQGEWKHDKKHGKGSYFHVEGAHYEGEWKHGEKSGFGIYYYADKDRYFSPRPVNLPRLASPFSPFASL